MSPANMLRVFMLFVFAVSIAAVGNSYEAFDTDDDDTSNFKFVDTVRQNYSKEVNAKLIEQIQREFTASFLYEAYASYFQRADVNLPGLHKWFLASSKEEKDHGQMLIDYVNNRGGHVTISTLDVTSVCQEVAESGKDYFVGVAEDEKMCICGFVASKQVNRACKNKRKWKSGLLAFQDALAVERFFNDQLLKIHKIADKNGDAHLSHFLEHGLLDDQVKSINEIAHFITRLESFKDYALGEYLFDQKLA